MTGTPQRGGGTLVTPAARVLVRRLGEPVALLLGRLGLSPNGLTLLGFAITLVAAALAGAQLWLAAGIVGLLGGVFDLFDGSLARATGRVSRIGAFLDSVFDRWGEAVMYLGIVIGSVRAGFGQGAALAAFAMGSAFLVSYTRAKAEGLGFTRGTGMAEVGLAPREVRLIILALGLVVSGLAGGVETAVGGGRPGYGLTDGQLWLTLALGAIGILSTITTIQRIIHVMGQTVDTDGK